MNIHENIEMECNSDRDIKQQYARYTKKLWHFYWFMVTVGLIAIYSATTRLLIDCSDMLDSYYAHFGLMVFVFETGYFFFLLCSERIQYCCFLHFMFANWWLLQFVINYLILGNNLSGPITAIFYFMLIFERKQEPHSCMFGALPKFSVAQKTCENPKK